jgi:hypothetical protein
VVDTISPFACEITADNKKIVEKLIGFMLLRKFFPSLTVSFLADFSLTDMDQLFFCTKICIATANRHHNRQVAFCCAYHCYWILLHHIPEFDFNSKDFKAKIILFVSRLSIQFYRRQFIQRQHIDG